MFVPPRLDGRALGEEPGSQGQAQADAGDDSAADGGAAWSVPAWTGAAVGAETTDEVQREDFADLLAAPAEDEAAAEQERAVHRARRRRAEEQADRRQPVLLQRSPGADFREQLFRSAAVLPTWRSPAPTTGRDEGQGARQSRRSRQSQGEGVSQSSRSSASESERRSAEPAADAFRSSALPKDVSPFMRMQLELLLAVARMRLTWLSPNIRRALDLVFSRSPVNDLSVLLYAAAVIGMPWAGFHFVLTIMTLLGCGIVLGVILRRSWFAAAPARFYAPLAVLPRASPWGFPCMELWVTPWALTTLADMAANTAGASTAVVLGLVMVLALRLYGATHMPHQLAGSLLAGFPVAALLRWAGLRIWPAAIPAPVKLAIGVGAGALLLAYTAYHMEANTSTIASIPKRECTLTVWLAGFDVSS